MLYYTHVAYANVYMPLQEHLVLLTNTRTHARAQTHTHTNIYIWMHYMDAN